MPLPLPPGIKLPAPDKPVAIATPPKSLPVEVDVSPNIKDDTSPVTKANGTLTEHEYGFILDSCLKPKHRADPSILAFIDAFIRCKNIAEAAAECGVTPKIGYSYRHRLDVANAIQKLIDKSSVKYGFDASEIMERTKEIVDFDPISMQNPDGTFKKHMYDIEPAARRNIKKLKVKNIWGESEDMNGVVTKIIIGEIIEYEFYDKLKAVELTGKEKDMFKNTNVVEHRISKDMASILLDSSRRGQQASVEYQNATIDTVAKTVETIEDAEIIDE